MNPKKRRLFPSPFTSACLWAITGFVFGPILAIQAAEVPPETMPGAGTAGAPVAEQQGDQFTAEELEELVKPIALYPDVLVAHILPAASEPLEVVQAARSLEDAGGKMTEEEINKLDYDVAVLALMHYPDVIKLLNEDLDWTSALGAAAAEQLDDVMQAIQVVRGKTEAAGNLESNDKMVIIKEKEVIKIESASPQVVYVPQYNPQVIYVTEEKKTSPVIIFAAGMAVGGWLAYGCHWGWGRSSCSVTINHRHYWGGVRPGWGGHPYWRPRPTPYARGHRAAYRAGWRHGHYAGTRTGARAGTRAEARAGARAGAQTGARTGAAAGARTGATAGARTGTAAGNRANNYGGYRSGTTTRQNSNRGAQSHQERPGASQRPSTAQRPSGGQRPSAGQRPSTGQRPTASQRPATAQRSPSSNRGNFGGYKSGSTARSHSSRGASSRGASRGGGRSGGMRGGGRRR